MHLMTSDFKGQTMECFRKCPKCGRNMVPQFTGNCSIPFVYTCECGYCDEIEILYDNKITHVGGKASGRTVN